MSDQRNNDLISAIKSRQVGKDVLSWIENFGLHLLEKGYYPHISFQNGESDQMLVLRIRNKPEKHNGNHARKNTISAYHCFFKTTDGHTRFCVNAACDTDDEELKDLMVDQAKWTDESTMNWWKEVFRDLKHPIDQDTLRRKEVFASESLKMNMMDFIEKIQEAIGKALGKLHVDTQKITKVCIVELYAMALPFRYAISQMFPNAKENVFPFVWKEKKMPWLQHTSSFHVPEKWFHTNLSTSPHISIADLLTLGERGFIVTLPLSKGVNEKYYLPSTSFIDNSTLRWNELMEEDVIPDHIADDLAFKRLQLSMFADGFQNIYVTGMGKTSVITLENGKRIVLNQECTENKQQVSEPILPESISPRPLVPETTTTQPTTIPVPLTEDRVLDIAYENKCEQIFNAVNNSLTRTLIVLKDIACSFLTKSYPENDWKEKYGEALKGKNRDTKTYSFQQWEDKKQIEFSNFLYFLWFYGKQIKSGPKRAKWWKSFSDIESAIKYLIIVRNFTTHQRYKVVGIGYRYLSRAFDGMLIIAVKLENHELEGQLQKYLDIFEENYDTVLKETWKTNSSLQEVYSLFEKEIKKYN